MVVVEAVEAADSGAVVAAAVAVPVVVEGVKAWGGVVVIGYGLCCLSGDDDKDLEMTVAAAAAAAGEMKMPTVMMSKAVCRGHCCCF